MYEDIQEVLFTQEQIRARVAQMGAQITADYADRQPLVVISVLKGAAIFMADLVRAIDLPLEMDFMVVSSYGLGAMSSGTVSIVKDLGASIEGKHVLIAEDILDSGLTLSFLVEELSRRSPGVARDSDAASQARCAEERSFVRLHRVRLSRRVHRRMRARLRRALSQPALRRRVETRCLPEDPLIAS